MRQINQKGFSGMMHILAGLVVLLGLGAGIYVLSVKSHIFEEKFIKNIFLSKNEIDKTKLSEKLNSFPLYPGAEFITQKQSTGCIRNKEGGALCNLQVYVFKTADSLKEVNEWYFKSHGAAGWNCDMGAFNIDKGGNSNEKQCDNEKKNLTYIFAAKEESAGTSLFIFTP